MKKTKKVTGSSFSYSDYQKWPEEERWEIINGVAYDMTPSPSSEHQRVSVELLRQLANFFLHKECKVFSAPFDVRLSGEKKSDDDVKNVVQPDILVVCDPKKIDEKGCRGAPGLVVEILSPSTASKDVIKKRELYERFGVKEFWIAHPTDKIVSVYHLDSKHAYGRPDAFDRDMKMTSSLFQGLEIDLSLVFPPNERKVAESPRKYLDSQE